MGELPEFNSSGGWSADGSIHSPSSVNNLAGIKPTIGLKSWSSVIPISEHQDTVGPMARTVTDAAYILFIIAGWDQYDNYTQAQPLDTHLATLKLLNFPVLEEHGLAYPGTESPLPILASASSTLLEQQFK
jgi:amidase